MDESKLRREARKRVRAPAVQALISKRPVRIPKRVGRPPKALKAQREAEAAAAAAAAAAASAAKSRKRSSTAMANGDRRGDGIGSANAAAAAAPASSSCPPSKRIKSTATTGRQVAVTSSRSSGATASPNSAHVASQLTMDSRDSQDRRQRCCELTGLRHCDCGSKPPSVAHEHHCCVVGRKAEPVDCGETACAGQGQLLCCGVRSICVRDRRAEVVDDPTQSLSPYRSVEHALENGVVSGSRRTASSSSCPCCSPATSGCRCCCCSRSRCTSGSPHSCSSLSSSPSRPQSVSSYVPLPRFDSVGSSSKCSENFAAHSPDSIFGFASSQTHSRTVSSLDQGGSFSQPFAFECADAKTTASAWSSGLAPSSSAREEAPPPTPTTTVSSWPTALPASSGDVNCSNYVNGGGGNVTTASHEAGRLMTLPFIKCEQEHLQSTMPLEQQQQQQIKCGAAATSNQQSSKSSAVTDCDVFGPRFITRFTAEKPVVDIVIAGMRSGACIDDYGGSSLRRSAVDGGVKKESEGDNVIIDKPNVPSSSSAMNFEQGCFRKGGRSEPVRRFGAPLDLLGQHRLQFNLDRGGVWEQEKWKKADAYSPTTANAVVFAAKAKVAAVSSEVSDGSLESTLTMTTSVDTTLARRIPSSSVEVTTDAIQRRAQEDLAMEDIDEYTCTASGPAPMPEPVNYASVDGDGVILITHDDEWPLDLELEREWILSCHVGGETNGLTPATGSLTNEGGRPLVMRSRDEDSTFPSAERLCSTIGGDHGRVVQGAGCDAQAASISFTAAENALGELSHASESCGLYDSQPMVCVFEGGDGLTFCSGVKDQNVESLLLPEDIGEILDELELPSLRVPDSQFTGLGSQTSIVKEEECPLDRTELGSASILPMETIAMPDGLLSDWLADDSVSAYGLDMERGDGLCTLDKVL
ncbi:hypothetical protein CBR_g37514 [Chara braunii]|uniref:Uncharacterized protein n=1 Tax=Chara braunii TaxID=69332 RepID=A0A388LNB9_CHABU|nr:hypothetical protein CBR_g37514 [Chara braunii]|eukprot:GBG83713.1 hypothetical protein CBR_g37514 [Chara braunii]